MNNPSYTHFLEFFRKHPSRADQYKDEDFAELKSWIDDRGLNLEEVLIRAIGVNDLDQVGVVVESIRLWYLLEAQGADLYKLLLNMAIEFVKQQTDSIRHDLMWNVKQVLDIALHQSHLVDGSTGHAELYFRLCYELLDPRFNGLRATDEFSDYDNCIYFVMFSDGAFKDNNEYLKKLQPGIQWIIDHDYGRDHHFSRRWMELFEKYT